MITAAVTPESFRALLQVVTEHIGNRPLDAALEADLNAGFPATGEVYGRILHSCRAAIEAGWMCAHAPTVTGGRALVLYLLPQGAIEFSR